MLDKEKKGRSISNFCKLYCHNNLKPPKAFGFIFFPTAVQPVMLPVRMTRSSTQAAKQIFKEVPSTAARKLETRAINGKNNFLISD